MDVLPWLVHLTLDSERLVDVFGVRLAQTFLWLTDAPSGPKSLCDFWDSRLRPSLLPCDRDESVRSVGRTRELLMDFEVRNSITPLEKAPSGRLLVFFPDATLSDQAAEIETQGFFDSDNVPPWDTWLAYFEDHDETKSESYKNYLVCLIPGHLREIVDRGILVNPEECIIWLDDSDTQFAKIWCHRR